MSGCSSPALSQPHPKATVEHQPESITTDSARPCSGHGTRGHAQLSQSLSPAFLDLSAKEILDLRDFPVVFLKKIDKDNSMDSSPSLAQQTYQLLHGV